MKILFYHKIYELCFSKSIIIDTFYFDIDDYTPLIIAEVSGKSV